MFILLCANYVKKSYSRFSVSFFVWFFLLSERRRNDDFFLRYRCGYYNNSNCTCAFKCNRCCWFLCVALWTVFGSCFWHFITLKLKSTERKYVAREFICRSKYKFQCVSTGRASLIDHSIVVIVNYILLCCCLLFNWKRAQLCSQWYHRKKTLENNK